MSRLFVFFVIFCLVKSFWSCCICLVLCLLLSCVFFVLLLKLFFLSCCSFTCCHFIHNCSSCHVLFFVLLHLFHPVTFFCLDASRRLFFVLLYLLTSFFVLSFMSCFCPVTSFFVVTSLTLFFLLLSLLWFFLHFVHLGLPLTSS